MSAGDSTEASVKDFLETRPKGTVIQVTDPAGSRFWLEAEGAIWRDFTHHRGAAPRGLDGRTSKVGRRRLFWSTSMLARWVAAGLCQIELASPPTKRGRS